MPWQPTRNGGAVFVPEPAPKYCACGGVWGMGDKCAKCGLPRAPTTPIREGA